MKSTLILVVEDEAAIRDMIRFALSTTDFEMIEAENAREAEIKLTNQVPDIVLLDWMLPGKSGVDFLRWQKQHPTFKDIPVIMLTAKAEDYHKVKGLTAGADDYITKPFSPKELVARVQTVLRRGPLKSLDNVIQIDDITLNTNTHEVSIANNIVPLTPIEYRLLYYFVTHQNKAYTRDQLLTHVWGGDVYHDERTVDVHIRRLRDQLKPHGADNVIQTVRGIGYQCRSQAVETSG